MNLSEINKNIEEIIQRNENIISEFTQDILAVELSLAWSKTSKEYCNAGLEYKSGEIGKITFNQFLRYGEIVADTINKISKKENRNEMSFENNEKANHNTWLKRIKNLNGGEIWIHLHQNMLDIVLELNDSRLEQMRSDFIKNNNFS